MIQREAHAKINLTLAVRGKREDGYHDLATIMQEISLADVLSAEKTEAGVTLVCDDPSLPTDDANLCVKAARLYLEAAGEPGGVALTLTKKIPSGAGLGGGSSDGAATLALLSELYPAEAELAPLAEKLGADVPFFLTGGTCLCTGVGEIVQPLYFPGKSALWCVVAQGEKGLSTPAVYRAYDEAGGIGKHFSTQDMAEAMTWGDPAAIYPLLFNDLEAPAYILLPEIRTLRDYLRSMGAEATQMTGSGSAVYGLFRDRDGAAWAAANVKNKGYKTFLCRLL